MKEIFILPFVFFFGIQASAQTDTALEYDFNSVYEEQVITGLFNGEYTDIIPLLLAVNPESDQSTQLKVQKEIDRLVFRLCKRNLERRSPSRMVKRAYYAVHRKKLFDFKENAEFVDVFKSGDFNCVTATALIAYVFTELDIPHTIREAPGHVFLIAETDKGRIFLETTDPVNGFIRDNKYLNNRLSRYAPQLGWNTVTGTKNPESQSAKDKSSFFTTAKEITLNELAGIQFYNGGVTALENKDFQAAFHYFRVADQIYENPQNTGAMRIALLNLLHNFDFSDMSRFSYLTHLAKFAKSDNDRRLVVQCFQKLSEQQLFVDMDAEAFRNSYFELYNATNDKTLRSLLQGFYLYDLGLFTIERDEPTKAIRLLERASQILPGVEAVNEALDTAYQKSQDTN